MLQPLHIDLLPQPTDKPEAFTYPFCYTPHPWARAAAEQVMDEVRHYMSVHPESELHTRGKMFGVLVVQHEGQTGYLKAFSAMLDGSYHHLGYASPVYAIPMHHIIGVDKQDSQLKQQQVFEQFHFLNAHGEERSLTELFADAALLHDFQGRTFRIPSGAGECCAPKLLQQAYRLGMQPLCMAEFWMGASSKDELRTEGQYYPACNGKCKPILRHMLQGLQVEENPLLRHGKELAQQIEVLYEDDAILVANKPSGLLTTPGKDGVYSLQEHLGVTPAHRLDMDTSGIVVCAKTSEALKLLQQQFLRRDIHKQYIAVLSREPQGKEGVIRLPLRPDPLNRPRQVVDHEHGKEAVTHWRGSGHTDKTIVELYPETGRTHQLRVHCAHPDGLNSPIAGDRLYGGMTSERLMLHAAEIRFEHPITHEMMTITSRPPFLTQPY